MRLAIFVRQCLLVAGSCVLSVSTFAQAPWKEEAFDKELNIKVYTRSVESSELKEFKGTTLIKAPLSAFVALLKDTEVATEWMKDVVEYRVLEESSETEALVYTVNAAPWPVTNRDSVIRTKMSLTKNGAVLVSLLGEPEATETYDDYVRMAALKGFWEFAPKSDGTVEVTYQVHADPGGSLPNWLVNSIVIETPLETLANMHDRIHDEKYQGKSYSFMQSINASSISSN